MLSIQLTDEQLIELGEKWAPLVQGLEGSEPIESDMILLSARDGDSDYYADLMSLGLILFEEQGTPPPPAFIQDARALLAPSEETEYPIQEALRIQLERLV